MAKFPGWIRVDESVRFKSYTLTPRWWHPAAWRFVAREVRQHAELRVHVAGRSVRVPRWLVAEVAAAYIVAKLAFGQLKDALKK